MKNKNQKTFFMFLMAFLVAFFIVSLVEVLRSSFIQSGAPEIQIASAVSSDTFKTPFSFSDSNLTSNSWCWLCNNINLDLYDISFFLYLSRSTYQCENHF